ncbi:phage tail protein [Rathayibacter rathayi]|uniref:Phage tail protein n=2 Tax=Rathayibacter rathayi TaxID=33887 RepID=A0ABX5ADF0_RATRA|nr:phage tail protein [Rathayibacter rathayi]SOE04537.1 Siderophore-interacting protein [Rathayibacter rathayi NCPPB 2980 = VKM Ac-1601]PPF22774.1 phage tail protein [Rathayibacter rathayi]PPF49337.1 phage tail protein [Rathayibacter rathayi]PPF81855.1 phage tail protein [Rathayibacter rathayi]
MCMFEDRDGSAPVNAKQFLIAGDESVVPWIQSILDVLPATARGQVFVEVDDARGLPPLAAPGRVCVTWLGRSERSGAPGTGERCRRGVALDRAVRAWVGEMSVIDGDYPWADDRHDFCAWIGGVGPVVTQLAADVEARLRSSSEHAAH